MSILPQGTGRVFGKVFAKYFPAAAFVFVVAFLLTFQHAHGSQWHRSLVALAIALVAEVVAGFIAAIIGICKSLSHLS